MCDKGKLYKLPGVEWSLASGQPADARSIDSRPRSAARAQLSPHCVLMQRRRNWRGWRHERPSPDGCPTKMDEKYTPFTA